MASDTVPGGLTVVTCAAGPASEAQHLVRIARGIGIAAVEVIATPAAVPFLKLEELADLCGAPVRSEYRTDGASRQRSELRSHPMIVAPATFNTVCKLANGISDNYALGMVAEALGQGRRVVIAPFVNTALAARRPFIRAVDLLRNEGAIVLLGAGVWVPHPPGTGAQQLSAFPWQIALDRALAD